MLARILQACELGVVMVINWSIFVDIFATVGVLPADHWVVVLARRMLAELLPIGALIYWQFFIEAAFRHIWWQEAMYGLCASLWTWMFFHDRNNRWKRRFRKAKEKVVEVAGRLVVRPAADPT